MATTPTMHRGADLNCAIELYSQVRSAGGAPDLSATFDTSQEKARTIEELNKDLQLSARAQSEDSSKKGLAQTPAS